MEALLSSIVPPRLAEISSCHRPPIRPLLKAPSFRRGGFLKTRENFNFFGLSSSSESSAWRSWSRFGALSRDVSGSGGAEEAALGNEPGFIANEGLPPEMVSFRLMLRDLIFLLYEMISWFSALILDVRTESWWREWNWWFDDLKRVFGAFLDALLLLQIYCLNYWSNTICICVYRKSKFRNDWRLEVGRSRVYSE